MSTSAPAWTSTPSSPTDRARSSTGSGAEGTRRTRGVLRRVRAVWDTARCVTKAARPVSGVGQKGIHTVAWGKGGLGGGVGGGTGRAHVFEHGRAPWSCGRGEGKTPDA